MRNRSVLRYYADRLRTASRGRRQLLSFALAGGMHAVGHALVALVASAVAVALAHAWGLPGARSSPLAARWQALAPTDQAVALTLVGLAVVAAKAAAGVYATYVQGRVAGEVGGSLRLELLDSLLAVHRLRRPRHDDQGSSGPSPPAHAASALTDRVHDVELGLQQGLLGGARSIAQLVPLALVLVVLSPRMALVAGVVLGVFGVLLGHVRGSYRRATTAGAREREQLLHAADEAVRHADLWVSYGAESKARRTVERLGDALSLGAARLDARAAALSGANEVLGALALLAAVAAARAGWIGGVASGETLLAFAVAFFLAYRPLRELADARLTLARSQGAFEELRAVIERTGLVASVNEGKGAPVERAWPAATLELRELSLARGGCRPLSLCVEHGAIVAILGPTGIGKTTLLRTLLGLETAASGEILFDGSQLEDAPAGPAGRPFAWVPQEAPLLADTLSANVSLGAVGADAREALEPLGAAHLARELDGARLGPGGRAVSGGERQWISLARAIATRQPVLLLDEPTSGLDAQSQARVLEAIARLRGRRTVLIVTHRPEPLAVADRIVRLEGAA